MRLAIVRHHPTPAGPHRVPISDEAALAAVETGRWLQSRGLNPGLAAKEHAGGMSETEWRLLPWCVRYTPTISGLAPLIDAAAFTQLVTKLERRYAKEVRGPRFPAGAGDDLVYVASAESVATISALSDADLPFKNLASAWILERDAAGWRVAATWPGRPPGQPARMPPARPVQVVVGRATTRAVHDRPWEEYLPFREDDLGPADVALLDGHGRRLPGRPLVEMTVDCQWGEHSALFTRWEVIAADDDGFTLEGAAGGPRRYPQEAWSGWLRRRRLEGLVTVCVPECAPGWCYGCDGSVVGERPYEGEEAAIRAAGALAGRRTAG